MGTVGPFSVLCNLLWAWVTLLASYTALSMRVFAILGGNTE